MTVDVQIFVHKKNDFAEAKNLARYRSKNNFVELTKIIILNAQAKRH